MWLSQMTGTEVGTAADQSEMEAQSAAAEEMSQRALDIGQKVFSAVLWWLVRAQGPRGRNERWSAVLPGSELDFSVTL